MATAEERIRNARNILNTVHDESDGMKSIIRSVRSEDELNMANLALSMAFLSSIAESNLAIAQLLSNRPV